MLRHYANPFTRLLNDENESFTDKISIWYLRLYCRGGNRQIKRYIYRVFMLRYWSNTTSQAPMTINYSVFPLDFSLENEDLPFVMCLVNPFPAPGLISYANDNSQLYLTFHSHRKIMKKWRLSCISLTKIKILYWMVAFWHLRPLAIMYTPKDTHTFNTRIQCHRNTFTHSDICNLRPLAIRLLNYVSDHLTSWPFWTKLHMR